LCLLSIETEPTTIPPAADYYTKQPLPGLQRLVEDVMAVLDEYARLEQLRREEGKDPSADDLDDLEMGFGEPLNDGDDLAGREASLKLWKSQLRDTLLERSRLEVTHKSVVRAVDHKLSVLLSVEEIFDEFFNELVGKATAYRVRDCELRANLVVGPCLRRVCVHPYLDTQEVSSCLPYPTVVLLYPLHA
jgi:hypothetical protein